MYLLWYGTKTMSWYDLMPLIFVHWFLISLHSPPFGVLGPVTHVVNLAGLSEWCGASTLRHASVALLVGRRAFGDDIRWQESPRCDGVSSGGGWMMGAPKKMILVNNFHICDIYIYKYLKMYNLCIQYLFILYIHTCLYFIDVYVYIISM